jgi:hypothetical protein
MAAAASVTDLRDLAALAKLLGGVGRTQAMLDLLKEVQL